MDSFRLFFFTPENVISYVWLKGDVVEAQHADSYCAKRQSTSI